MYKVATIVLMTDGSESVHFSDENYESYESAQAAIPTTVYLQSGEFDQSHLVVSAEYVEYRQDCLASGDTTFYDWEKYEGACGHGCGCCDDCMAWMAEQDVADARDEADLQKQGVK